MYPYLYWWEYLVFSICLYQFNVPKKEKWAGCPHITIWAKAFQQCHMSLQSTCLHETKRHTNKNSSLISPHCIHNQRRHPTNENSVGIHQNHVGICAKEPPPPLTEDTNAALEGFLKCRGCWRRMGEQAQIVYCLLSSSFLSKLI